MVKNNRYHTRYTSNNNTNNRTSIIPLAKELGFALFLLATVLIFSPKSASAATFNVATGTSQVTADSICQIDEAITNINDGARTEADCVETGTYGTDDTINLPVGTITGPGSMLIPLNKSTKIIGQGRGVSFVDDLSIGLFGSGVGVLEVSNLTMTGGGEGMGIGGIEADVVVDNVEIDTEDQGVTAIYGENSSLTVRDSYLHNLTGSGIGLIYANASSANVTVNVERTTFAQANSGITLEAGSGYTIDATIKNSTFTDLHGDSNRLYQNGAGINLYAGNNSGNQINYTTINNTFSNITNSTPGSYPATAIFEYAEEGTINHTAQNDLYAVGDGTANAVNYYRPALSGSGDPLLGTFTTTSNGGNVSSDNSFSSYLTQSSDKHSQTNLASFLGVLTDNGGSVPTLALSEGSPAIDAGTSVSGMTTDARGVARPQGGAFDAGAYELAMSTPDPESGSSAVINNPNGSGTISLTGTPTIPKRPTFSGTTTPNSTVSVTVHSDPVVCTATADSSGNWSCTLPSDLEPGTHTVTIQITKPDSSTETLGPYTVTVVAGASTTVTSKDLANTGQNNSAITIFGGSIALVTAILALPRLVKRRIKFSLLNR